MIRFLGWTISVIGLTVCAGAATNSVPPSAPAAATPDARYVRLTLKNLAPIEAVLQAAADAVPEFTPKTADWDKRMRKAAWVPRLELRSLIGQQPFRDYTVVNRPSADSFGAAYLTQDSYSTGESPRWLNEYEVAVTWDFSQLVFRPDEVNIARLQMEAARIRLDREAAVSAARERAVIAYYDLVEALRLLELETYRASVPTLMRKERAAAMVDDISNGCVTKHLNGGAVPDRK
ncbi:MAG: hypothetical protein KJ579_06150 [Verrucomicrobia bacterium]|nr:hypothetical protein [Verrucomicrobiota bacterium]